MALVVDSRTATPVNRLRELLDQAERQLPSLRSDGLTAYLLQLDTIEHLWPELTADAGGSARRREPLAGPATANWGTGWQVREDGKPNWRHGSAANPKPTSHGRLVASGPRVAAQRQHQLRQWGIALVIFAVLAVRAFGSIAPFWPPALKSYWPWIRAIASNSWSASRSGQKRWRRQSKRWAHCQPSPSCWCGRACWPSAWVTANGRKPIWPAQKRPSARRCNTTQP